MSIKVKLTAILGLIGVILASLAGVVAWKARQITGQVKAISPALDHLQAMGEVRSRSYDQMHQLVHYFVYGEEQGRAVFETLKRGILTELQKTAEAPHPHPGTGAEKEQSTDRAALARTYSELLTVIDQAVLLKRSGKTGEGTALLEKKAEPLMDVFHADLNEDILFTVGEIAEHYDIILSGLGVLPWPGNKNVERVQGARLSLQYFLAVDRLSWAMNRQVNEIVEYLVSGDEQNLRQFEEAGFEADMALGDCKRTIKRQIQLGMEGEQDQYVAMDELERNYRGMLMIVRDVVALHRSGLAGRSFSLMEEKLKPRIDASLLPKIKKIIDGSREEIAEAHQGVLNAVFMAGLIGMIVISAAALALFVASQRLVRDMVAAISRMKMGAEIVGSGDLYHRIDVRSRDELGDLANSFNRMTQALKEGDEDLKAFLFSLSHDLRSPLVNLKGFSRELAHTLREFEALLGRERAALSEEERGRLRSVVQQEIPAMLGFIEASSDKMGELISAVMKLSRTGQMPLRPEPVDAAVLAQSVLGRFEEEINAKNIAVSVGALPQVIADRQALEQIFRNLLDNAIKYLVADRAGRIEITGERQAQDTVFQVRDNGRGIARDDVQKAFDMFRRVGQQNVPGEGMGLAYARTLVRRHGGRIWCESTLTAGSTFSFSIPHPAPRR